eukprot:573740-Prymnesium_polylepis.1
MSPPPAGASTHVGTPDLCGAQLVVVHRARRITTAWAMGGVPHAGAGGAIQMAACARALRMPVPR